MRQIRKWREVQLVYMPSAAGPDHGTDEIDADDCETPESVPLVLPSQVDSDRRNAVCLHRVAEYERQLRLAQLQDSLAELRRVRRIRHSLLTNHHTQIAGQGQRVNTRSRALINSIDERINKFVQRYRAAYNALIRLDPVGQWHDTHLELKDEDNRGPDKEDEERGLGDGSYTISWIWLLNPRARDTGQGGVGGVGQTEGEVGRPEGEASQTESKVDQIEGEASQAEVNDVMRVQWATSQARLKRWTEEVKLLQEEMRRVVMFLEWKSEDWFAKKDSRIGTTPPSIQSGLQAYARKQAAVYHNLAVSFVMLWRPTLVSCKLDHAWITDFVRKHKISLPDLDAPVVRPPVPKTAIPEETTRGLPQASTPHPIPIQASSRDAMVHSEGLLEEITSEDEDEDEYYHYGAWESPSHLDLVDSDSDVDFDYDYD